MENLEPIKKEFDINTIKLIIGLGNMDKRYKNTRHNVGFSFIETLADGHTFRTETKFKAAITEAVIQNKKRYLAMPTTFMNNSGIAVNLLYSFLKIRPEEILVAHDDLDIQLGSYKIQFDKGPKVHNGINSIENSLNTSKFWRLRIGIDNRTDEQKIYMTGSDYVLSRFMKDEISLLNTVFQKIINNWLL